MKIICVHHKDSDGYISALVVKAAMLESNFNQAEISFVPYNYYEEIDLENLKTADRLYLVDISLPTESMFELKQVLGKNMIWIDHHKSAIARMAKSGEFFAGLQSTEEAACLLSWRYFYGVNRKAPLLVETINKYDNWRKDESWDSFTFPLNLCVMTLFRDVEAVDIRLLHDDEAITQLVNGVGTYLSKFNDDLHLHEGKYIETRIVEQDGQLFNAYLLNTTMHTSLSIDLFEKKGNPVNPVKIVYTLYGDKARVSVYTDSEEFDCAKFAQQFEGGGGHKSAAGFITTVDKFFALFK
jgi:oligoribonuclease NrnB/cAMP/cGMP phosphodiesterase (DHH superfamily)